MVSPFFALLFVLYSIGRHLEGAAVRRARVRGRLRLIAQRRHYDDDPATPLHGRVLVVGADADRRLLRNRAALNRALREKARRSSASARSAPPRGREERTRIAGELHDVVAHALSAMVVQAAGARAPGRPGPGPRRATRSPRSRRRGREALDELRRLLGVLRRDDEELALAPQPSLRTSRSLAAAHRGGRPAGRARGRGRGARPAARPRPHRLPRRPGGARRRARPRRRRPRRGAPALRATPTRARGRRRRRRRRRGR